MIQIILPDSKSRILPFYLAAEEWVARYLSADEYFFAWQVSPTVICGRHQIMHREVDMDFCQQHGIKVWRRKSGGGCVYADMHNIMFSYITPSSGVQTSFNRYTTMVSDMLGSLGLDARSGGRNDVEISGMKVAGNAYYGVPGHSIVHGTMLYDADFATMSRALTPSRAKLSSKGVKSVPSRITTLKAQGLQISCDEFIDYALSYLCKDGVVVVNDEQVAQIEEIMQSYLTADFYDDKPCNVSEATRIEGAGEFACDIVIDNDNKVAGCRLSGDFFALADVNEAICRNLFGVAATRDDIATALSSVDVASIIPGMNNDALTTIINESINQLHHT